MRSIPFCLLVGCALALPLSGRGAGQGAGDGERAESTRLDDLERRNRELEGRVAELEEARAAEEGEQDLGLGMGVAYEGVGARFQIFGDVGLRYENPAEVGEGHDAFFLGSTAFFVNMSLGEDWRVLSETVLEGESDDEIATSQERLWGAWVPEDRFYAKLGTEHSPVSRWNQLFHHGRWLETTTARPILASFEGEGGILPLHRTGITLGGTAHTGSGRFEYFGTVSNGRGELPSDKQRTNDADDHKAIDLGLAFEPFGESDWRFGVAAIRDTIPMDPASLDPLRMRSMREVILTTHAEWRRGPWYALGEFAYVDHEVDGAPRDYRSNASYLQFEYRVEEWTPYTRIDHRNMAQGDPFYSPLARDLDVWLTTLGLRWDLGTNVALKFETSYGREDHMEVSGTIEERGILLLGMQLSWWL